MGALPVPAPLHPDQPTPHPQRLASSKAHTSRFITASLPCNKFKNRLVNILPYESSRVCLQPIRGVEGSDYINASFIDGYRCTGPAFRAPPQPVLPDETPGRLTEESLGLRVWGVRRGPSWQAGTEEQLTSYLQIGGRERERPGPLNPQTRRSDPS